MPSFHFFLGLLLGFVALLNATPITQDNFELTNVTLPGGNFTVQGYDPSNDYFDYTTVQLWLSQHMTTVGNVIGLDLYKAIYGQLDAGCPWRPGPGGCSGVKNTNFQGRCLKTFPAQNADCTTNINDIHARWDNPEIRHLLIEAAAQALQQVTYEKVIGPTNCHAVGSQRQCNVPSLIRINFPTSAIGGHNYLHFRLYNSYTGYGTYHCCLGEKRQRIDKILDQLGPGITAQFAAWQGKPFTRDTKCIINGWEGCPLT